MDNLLDTHTFLWYIEGNANLSENAKKLIENPGVINYISIASFWEISIKSSLNKIELKVPFPGLAYYISFNKFQLLPIAFEDTLIVSALPLYHRDPFDRIIIAQAMHRNLRLLSKDELFGSYNISLSW